MTRRAIEKRFRTLHREGFDTVAVLDLDHFKAINDRYGHAVGDDVLKACASWLGGVTNQPGLRMGVEEFLLLLRGPGALARAEDIRRGLAQHIADEVNTLDPPVPASGGVVQGPMSFPASTNSGVV